MPEIRSSNFKVFYAKGQTATNKVWVVMGYFLASKLPPSTRLIGYKYSLNGQAMDTIPFCKAIFPVIQARIGAGSNINWESPKHLSGCITNDHFD